MKNLIVIIDCPTSGGHRLLVAEALKKTAAVMELGVKLQLQGPDDTYTLGEISTADVVVLISDTPADRSRFADKPVYETSIANAIRNTHAVLEAALGLLPQNTVIPAADTVPERVTGKRLVGITACPTGIAHTFMAATALEKAANLLGHVIKIETHGSVGAKNQLTEEDIETADAVVIAADIGVDLSRFTGKPVFSTGTKSALRDGQSVIESALAQPEINEAMVVSSASKGNANSENQRSGAYKHLMTGVSFMLPVVIAGGLSIALAFAIGGINAGDTTGTIAWALKQIGGDTAFNLFVAVLSAFIAYSIADRPGIAAGLVGGMLAHTLGAGFLGGILSGFLAGYVTKLLADRIKLPVNLEGLKPILILPFFSTVIVGLLMIYVIAPPVEVVNRAMTDWLSSMSGTNALLFGAILGGMMAFDMGGPVNKAAYTFAVGLLASKIYTAMAVVMAAGMVPPLGLGLAAFLFKNRFDREEREAGGPALVLGAAFITEGAIPFAAKDPLHFIPALVVGSAVTGAISMAFGVQLLVPHGGIFAMFIPGAVTNLLPYLGAIVIGTVITAAVLFVTKKRAVVSSVD
jgi:PTS system fructose-specific IIC component